MKHFVVALVAVVIVLIVIIPQAFREGTFSWTGLWVGVGAITFSVGLTAVLVWALS